MGESLGLSLDEECGAWTHYEATITKLFSYWLEGIFLIVVGLLGLLGNSISVLVLSSSEMRNSFNYFLLVLAVVDNIFLTVTLMDYAFVRVFEWPINTDSEMYALIFPKWIYPTNNICLTASIFLIMVIAHERYVAVCHPHDYVQSQKTGVKRRFAIGTTLVFVLSILINIPKFFETEIVHLPITPTRQSFLNSLNSNGINNTETIGNDTMLLLPQQSGLWWGAENRNYTISYEVTDLRKDPMYIRYYVNWCLLLFTGILPLVFLLYYNYRIFQGIRFTHARCRSSRSGELNLAVILVCIVVVFVVCHFLRVILNCFELVMVDTLLRCGEKFLHSSWFHCVNSISHLLLVMNSSANFVIYCCMGTKFKMVLSKFACRLFTSNTGNANRTSVQKSPEMRRRRAGYRDDQKRNKPPEHYQLAVNMEVASHQGSARQSTTPSPLCASGFTTHVDTISLSESPPPIKAESMVAAATTSVMREVAPRTGTSQPSSHVILAVPAIQNGTMMASESAHNNTVVVVGHHANPGAPKADRPAAVENGSDAIAETGCRSGIIETAL